MVVVVVMQGVVAKLITLEPITNEDAITHPVLITSGYTIVPPTGSLV